MFQIVVKGCGFGVFTGALGKWRFSVRGINAKGQGGIAKKEN